MPFFYFTFSFASLDFGTAGYWHVLADPLPLQRLPRLGSGHEERPLFGRRRHFALHLLFHHDQLRE